MLSTLLVLSTLLYRYAVELTVITMGRHYSAFWYRVGHASRTCLLHSTALLFPTLHYRVCQTQPIALKIAVRNGDRDSRKRIVELVGLLGFGADRLVFVNVEVGQLSSWSNSKGGERPLMRNIQPNAALTPVVTAAWRAQY